LFLLNHSIFLSNAWIEQRCWSVSLWQHYQIFGAPRVQSIKCLCSLLLGIGPNMCI